MERHWCEGGGVGRRKIVAEFVVGWEHVYDVVKWTQGMAVKE